MDNTRILIWPILDKLFTISQYERPQISLLWTYTHQHSVYLNFLTRSFIHRRKIAPQKQKQKKKIINKKNFLKIPEFDDCLDSSRSASSISSKEILTNDSIQSTANSSPIKEDKKFVIENNFCNRNANTFSGSFSTNTNLLTPINNKKNLQSSSPRSPRNPVTGEGINAPSSGRQKKMSYRRGNFQLFTFFLFCWRRRRRGFYFFFKFFFILYVERFFAHIFFCTIFFIFV